MRSPVFFENGFLFITPGGDVIDCTGIFYPEGAGHAATLALKK